MFGSGTGLELKSQYAEIHFIKKTFFLAFITYCVFLVQVTKYFVLRSRDIPRGEDGRNMKHMCVSAHAEIAILWPLPASLFPVIRREFWMERFNELFNQILRDSLLKSIISEFYARLGEGRQSLKCEV